MTKEEAIVRLAKLQRLAAGSSSPAEADTAHRRISELVEKYKLGEADLAVSRSCAAYDDLVDQLNIVLGQTPAGLLDTASFAGQISQTLKSTSDADKASRLRTVTRIVRTVGWVLGKDPLVSRVQKTLEDVLRKHDVTI